MKKLFTLALLALVAMAANAEVKKWDFTSWSQASAICAASDWTVDESASKSYITGNEIRWNLNASQVDANGNVLVGSVAIAELQGLKFTLPAYGLGIAFDYQTTTDGNNWGPYYGGSYLWFTGTGTTFTIPNVLAGTVVKIGVESHKPGDARGFTVKAGETSEVLKSADYAELQFTVPGESGTCDVTFTPTKGCHLYFVEADVNATSIDPTPVDPTPGGDDDPGVNPDPEPQPETAIGFATWSLKDGGKIRPSKDILLSFPNADPTVFTSADEIEVAGTLTAVEGEPIEFDGLGGNFVDGIVIPLGDLEAEENTDYVLNISSVLVNGTDYAPKAGFTLNFSTRAAERKLSWTFVIDEASSTLIQSDIDLGDAAKYWTLTSGDDNGYQRAYTKARNYEPMMLPDETELPMTEQLLFKTGDSKVYVGNANNPAKDYNKAIVFNANDIIMVIPDCTPGDIIKFNAKYATKSSSSKRTYIKAIDGAALAINGLESSSGLVDSLQVGSSYTDYKFTVQTEGDVAFYCSQMWLKTIEISEAKPIVDCKYVVNASYTDDEGTKVIKNVATEQVGKTNDAIVMPYSYWVTDDEGKLYTHGAKGTEFSEMFDLQSDTTFTINYKKLEPEGFVKVVYLTEAEDLEGTVLCTSGNAAVRSSNKKAAYTESDITLCTLEPGDYKIKLVIFDAQKTASQVESFMVGEEPYDFMASATNFDEQESDVITVTTPTPVVWKGHEATENAGLDIVMIYAYDVLTGIENVNNVKVANGKMFNIAGQTVSNNFKGIVVVNGKKFVK